MSNTDAVPTDLDDDLAVLVLEDGSQYWGLAYGAQGVALGEVVFATGMTGYEETLTDPSYARQLVVQTAPHIGNTGVTREDAESFGMQVGGYIVRDPARRPSNWRAQERLEERLHAENIVGMCEVDTRALVRHVRECGVLRGGIFSGPAAHAAKASRLEQVRAFAPEHALAESVTTQAGYVIEPSAASHQDIRTPTVVALDMGMKAAIPRCLAERGIRVQVLSASSSWEELRRINPDGVVVSNGPGDPATATGQIEVVRQVLRHKIPFLGICFGHQLFARALGFGTYRLHYGHRGINQPVLDRATGRVEITAQNHGFAVDLPLEDVSESPEFGRVTVSHVSLNDRVVEGLRCLDLPAMSVQYHPEASAGPHDSSHIFDRFVDLMQHQSRA